MSTCSLMVFAVLSFVAFNTMSLLNITISIHIRTYIKKSILMFNRDFIVALAMLCSSWSIEILDTAALFVFSLNVGDLPRDFLSTASALLNYFHRCPWRRGERKGNPTCCLRSHLESARNKRRVNTVAAVWWSTHWNVQGYSPLHFPVHRR